MLDHLVVVGSINLDRTVVVERFPVAGETLLADSLTTAVGGKGANQAVAAARSGGDVEMVAVVGDDVDGHDALRTLRDAAVDTGSVARTDAAPTGSAWITVAAGDNTILVVPGANHQWGQPLRRIRAHEVMLCQLEIPLRIVQTVVADADPGALVIVNAAPATPLPTSLLRRCDHLVVNEHELRTLSDRDRLDPVDTAAVVAAARELIGRGARSVVVTLGSLGACLVTHGAAYTVAAPTRTEVVDTTGAGDAFCGVFAARVAGGATPADAVRAAVSAGSLAVRHQSAQGGYDLFAGLDATDLLTGPVEEWRED